LFYRCSTFFLPLFYRYCTVVLPTPARTNNGDKAS
jgi:hypothetical protein